MRGRQSACCFTGHRPGKLPWGLNEEDPRCLELKRRLWDAVEGLDEPDRTLFLRYYYCGDKLKDIARALGLTQTAAKQRLFRGRKALRDTLTKGGVEA